MPLCIGVFGMVIVFLKNVFLFTLELTDDKLGPGRKMTADHVFSMLSSAELYLVFKWLFQLKPVQSDR